jgi:phosphate-selective porin OprO and OprP
MRSLTFPCYVLPTAILCLANAACGVAQAQSSLSLTPIANLQYDTVLVDEDTLPSRHAHDLRRARLGVRISSSQHPWQLVMDHDLADRTPPDFFLEVTPKNGTSLRFGQFKQPFTLEDAIADKQTAFMEASPVGAFVISRRLGAEYARWGKHGTFNIAAFGKRLDGSNEAVGMTTRGTWRLALNASYQAHIGMSLATESPQYSQASFSTNAGTVLDALKTTSTGTLTGVNRVDRFAVEGVWIKDAWSIQGEAASVFLRRDTHHVRGDTASLQMTWSPTGDGRNYKRGVATAPTPQGHIGWEIALRYGVVDLNDGTVRGGRSENWGIAVTCYPHTKMRVVANIVQSKGQRAGHLIEPLTAGLRLQFTY